MTRWSLRRRSGADQDAAQAYRPGAGAFGGSQPPKGQPQAAQSADGRQQDSWQPDSWTRARSSGWSEAGQPQAAVGLLTESAPRLSQTRQASRAAWDAPAMAVPDTQPEAASPQPASAWPDICDQFGLHMLVLAEQLRASLDELEADEDDPERLQRLYHVDHAVTRMRRASRDLRILAGRSEEELAGFTTSLLDIIRMAASSIERYTQVSIGRVTDLAVLGYAADDLGSLIAALLDNATRYSPGTVTMSGHLLADGAVMFRIEDTGIGMSDEQIAQLNTGFAGPVADVDERTGRHTGFPVVHRIARKHSIGVRLTSRPAPSTGTVAMVTLPPHLLCEVPVEDAQRLQAPAARPARQEVGGRPSAVPDLSRTDRSAVAAPQRPAAGPATEEDQEAGPGAAAPDEPAELPRRERASLRGDAPRRTAEPAPALSAEQQAAARRAFAAELNAFSLGSAGHAESADSQRDNGETSGVDDTVSSQQGSLYQEGTVL